MATDFKHRLMTHRGMLLKTLEPRYGLVETLSSFEVISDEECEELAAKNGAIKRNMKLLEIMMTKTDDDVFENFRKSLEQTGQKHVLNYLNCDGRE